MSLFSFVQIRALYLNKKYFKSLFLHISSGKKPLIIYTVLLTVQLGLVIALFVFAAQGKSHMDDSLKGTDIPYYAGAFIVAAVVHVLKYLA